MTPTRFKASLVTTCITALSLSLLGCENGPIKKDYTDSTVKLMGDDFKKTLLPEHAEPEKKTAPATPTIPDVASIIIPPKPPMVNKDKLVSLSVTEDVPLRDVLIELGRLADVDMEIDHGISGGIILKVKDRPLSEVLEQIANQANLRYTHQNGVLKIERDLPYIDNYQVDFLNITRSNSSSISVNTTVASGGSNSSDSGSNSGSGTGNTSSGSNSGTSSGNNGGSSSTSNSSSGGAGSNNSITTQSDGDLWTSIQGDLEKIIGAPSTITTTPTASSTVSGFPSAAPAPAPVAQVSSNSDSFLSINRQAGIITVRGTSKQHGSVRQYLNQVKEKTSAQVLIEAKVVEVSLSDEFKTGINWNVVDKNMNLGLRGSFTENILDQSDKVTIGIFDKVGRVGSATLDSTDNLQMVANLAQLFGTTRTLSSPRLHAINNQQAVLSFAKNQVYFTVRIERTDAQTGGTTVVPAQTTVSSSLNTVPIGIILALQPSINLDTNSITMNIRPTISRIIDYVEDPAVRYLSTSNDANLGISSRIPVVETKELDSILKIKSGQVMVIGGLMEELAENKNNGIPLISDIPWAGHFFKTVHKNSQVVQTVIFIKATIVPGSNVPNEDKQFYKTFTRDPNPLTF